MSKPRVRRGRRPRPAADLKLAIEALEERKALDGVVLDLRGLSEAADYFVVCSGTSDAHVRGMAESVVDRLTAAGQRLHHIEGLAQGRWVLVDYVDVVIHIFHPAAREFYQLERLWGDAPTRTFGAKSGA